MDRFTRQDLNELMAANGGPCVSILMPTHRTGHEIRADVLQCKNLRKEAEEQLIKLGHRSPVARQLLEPIDELLSNEVFWKYQSDGLAAFLAPGVFKRFRVPLPLDPLAVVGERFHTRALLPLLQGDGKFYLLAASQKQLRLLEGSHYSISELEVEGLPTSLQDALNIDEYVQAMQYHTGASVAPGLGGGRDRSPIFHGHGGGDMDIKKRDEILQYFHRVDSGLREFFHDQRTPLLFAGVEYLFPIFREACSYRGLLADAVRGNPDKLTAEQLHAKAWSLIEPNFKTQQRAALDRYAQHAADDTASSDARTIIDAAKEGRVDTLFIAQEQQLWGRLDGGNLNKLNGYEPGAVDILNHAAAHTLLCNGNVYVLPRQEMPQEQAMAAVFRYAGAPRDSAPGE